MIKNRKITVTLLVLIVLTLISIFVHSAMSPEVSSSESGAVGDIVEEIVPDEFSLKQFILDNIRKIAHFIEFGLLGAEVYCLVIALEAYRLKSHLLSLGFGALVAFADESVQILSNRGPSVADMWIDIAGYVCLSLLAAIIHLAVYLIRKKMKSR